MQTILVLFGGCSTEYEVSLQSAHAVLQALDHSRYVPLTVGITREGRWLRYSGSLFHLETGDWASQPDCVPCALSLDRGDLRLLWLDGSGRSEPFDAAFPVLHGKNGEDGTVQGLLELIGAPIIGCGALSSALCMDKDRSHKLAALAGVRVPRGHLFRRGAAFQLDRPVPARLPRDVAALFQRFELFVHHFVETLFHLFLSFSDERAHLAVIRRKHRAAHRAEQKPDRKFFHNAKPPFAGRPPRTFSMPECSGRYAHFPTKTDIRLPGSGRGGEGLRFPFSAGHSRPKGGNFPPAASG